MKDYQPKAKTYVPKRLIPVMDEPIFTNVPEGWIQHYDEKLGYYILRKKNAELDGNMLLW